MWPGASLHPISLQVASIKQVRCHTDMHLGNTDFTPCVNCGSVMSWAIWAFQKLSGGSLLDSSELPDPRTLGHVLIFDLYIKPTAYCSSLLLLGTLHRGEM